MHGKALIMMATYNGSHYISKQLDSIIEQSYDNWNLLISDDGSSDGTLQIIDSYSKKDNRILPVLHHQSDFGASSNFYYLMEKVKEMSRDYDYFFFSDQDDIWIVNKIKKQVEALVRCNKKAICYSDLMVMTAREADECRMSKMQNIKMNKPEDIFFNQIYIWGNTLAFNRKMMDYLIIPKGKARQISHDHYVGFYGAAFGDILYIDVPLVRYRRYESNVSELPHKYNFSKVIKQIINARKLINRHAANYAGILYFINNAPCITKKLEAIKMCYEMGGIRSLKIINNLGVKCGANRWNSIAKKAILFTKIYKISDSFRSYNYN